MHAKVYRFVLCFLFRINLLIEYIQNKASKHAPSTKRSSNYQQKFHRSDCFNKYYTAHAYKNLTLIGIRGPK